MNDFSNDIDIVYISENDEAYTAKDFLEIAKGNRKLAEIIYSLSEWQSPYTVLDELIQDEEVQETPTGYMVADIGLKKICSTASRPMREGEIEGWSYYFMSRDEILSKKENGELMQFIDFNDTLYGYEKKEFDNISELLVVCGGSGAGKDTVFSHMASNIPSEFSSYFDEPNVGFLFSIPETITLFDNYAKEEGIPNTNIFLKVSEEERARRVILGELSGHYGEDADLLSVTVDGLSDGSLSATVFFDGNDVTDEYDEIIEQCISRVTRDRDGNLDFEKKIDALIQKGINIRKIDVSDCSVEETKDLILSAVKNNRAKRENLQKQK